MENQLDNNMPIEYLGLSARSYNCLKRNGINAVGQVVKLNADDLSDMKNMGKNSTAEVMRVISILLAGDMDISHEHLNSNKHSYKPTKVLHYIDEKSIVEEVSSVLYYNQEGLVVEDILVEELKFSARTNGILLRTGYDSVAKIMNMGYADLAKLSGMGTKCVDEIISRLKEISWVRYEADGEDTKLENVTTMFMADINENCSQLKDDNLIAAIKTALFKIQDFLIDIDKEDVLNNNNIINIVYGERIVARIFKRYICSLLRRQGTLTFNSLEQYMPKALCASDRLTKMINELQEDKKIEETSKGFRYYLPTVMDYIELLDNEREKEALLCRLKGMTLEDTGQVLGVTRERARQIANKALSRMKKLREDNYKYWFEKYDLTKEEFMNIFEFTEESYNYLHGTYKKGSMTLEDIFSDEKITADIEKRADVEMQKYCVLIENEYVPIKRENIVKKLLKVNFSEKESTLSEFHQFYMEFLRSHHLENNEKLLYPTERAMEARLSDNRYTLLKYGKRIRYYNIDEYDINRLLDEIGFDQYEGLEISTLKLFAVNSELMMEYNLKDEYELHNMLKKCEDKTVKYNVDFGRMPFVSVGKTDREKQVVDFLFRVAPIGLYEFGDAYEAEYGVKAETVLANFAQYIDKYYHNSTFTVDQVQMEAFEFQVMEKKLIEDFYYIDQLKEIFSNEYPEGDILKINPYNLKALGFQVYVDYVVRNTYDTADRYFNELFCRNDILNLDDFDKKLSYNQTFSHVLGVLRSDYELLEFEPNKYIKFSKFITDVPNVGKEDLKQFAIDAANYSEEEFFTIKSLKNQGFSSKIDDLNYSDWFYGSLLRGNKTIRYSKVAGGFLFAHFDRQFKRSDFFYFIMSKLKSICIIEFIDYIQKEYGLVFDRYDIIPIISNTNMIYSPVTEKIYINKEEYYSQIDVDAMS